MIEVFEVESKTKEDALNKCLELTQTDLRDLYIKETEIEGKIFKSKKYSIRAIKKSDVINFIKEYLKTISSLMNIDIKYEVKEKDDVINVLLVSNNNAILIGKEGRTLNSLQILLKQAINAKTGLNIRIILDASDYKSKKLKNLEYEVKKIAKEVLNTKIEAKLDPMNSYERRFVHTIISEYDNLITESNGETPNRYVTIKYKEK